MKKAWRDYMVDWYLKKIGLNLGQEPASIYRHYPNRLEPHKLKVVQFVFLPVKIEEPVHSMKAIKMIG